MPFIFSEADLASCSGSRTAFNPTGRCNPGKIFPSRKACVEAGPSPTARIRSKKRAWPSASSAGGRSMPVAARPARQASRRIVGAANVLTGVDCSPVRRRGPHARGRGLPGLDRRGRRGRWSAGRARRALPSSPWGGGTARRRRDAAAAGRPRARSRAACDRILEHEPGDLTATVEAGMPVATLQGALRRSAASGSRSTRPRPSARPLGGILASQRLRPPPAPVRHRARPADRPHRRHWPTAPWCAAAARS